MTVDIDENILRLEISVEHIIGVESLEGLHDLNHIEHRHLLRELLPLAQEVEQLASDAQVHHQKQLGLVLESPVQVDHEVRVLKLPVDGALSDDG